MGLTRGDKCGIMQEQLRKEVIIIKWPKKLDEIGVTVETTETIKSLSELEDFIISVNPLNLQNIAYLLFIIRNNAKEKKIDKLVDLTIKIDNSELWKKCKEKNKTKKYFSYSDIEELLRQIKIDAEFVNYEYCISLIKAVFEGVYSRKLTVLKNLYIKDIDTENNHVTLRFDKDDVPKEYGNTPIVIPITNELTRMLVNQARLPIYRANRNGVFEVNPNNLQLSPNHVFKIERRKDNELTSAFISSYYSRIREIKNRYELRSFLVKDIYISGLMYKIKKEVEKEGVNLKSCFVNYFDFWEEKLDKLLKQFDYAKLYRTSKDLRRVVRGHIDEF